MCNSNTSKNTGTGGTARSHGLEGLFPAGGGPTALAGSFRGAQFLDIEAFQNVADLHIVKISYSRTALIAGAHFAGVIFEALQRTELGGVNDGSVANDADLGITLKNPVENVAARHGASTFDAEGVAHLGAPKIVLLNDRLQQTFHCFLNLVSDLVDDVVRTDIHAFALREIRGLAVGTNAEGDDNGARCGCQQHIVLRDRPCAGADNFHLDLIG